MRNKTIIITAIICAVVFLTALALLLYQNFTSSGSQIEVLLDGEVIYRGPDTQTGEPVIIVAAGKEYTNRIRIDAEGVRVVSTDCPNSECVHMGTLKYTTLPIVCLPNHLIIHYVSDASALSLQDEFDAISQ